MSTCKKKNGLSGSSQKQPQPPPPASQSNDLDSELQLLYNNYLQVSYTRELVKLEIEKKKRRAEEQLLHYKKILEEKQNALQKIDDEMNLLQKKSEAIESLNALEAEGLNTAYLGTKSVELKDFLLEISKIVKLINIDPLNTQDQVNMLCDALKNLGKSLEDVKNVTKNSTEIHDFVECIEKFSNLKQNIEESLGKQQRNTDKLNQAIITKLSNIFAEQYDNIEISDTVPSLESPRLNSLI